MRRRTGKGTGPRDARSSKKRPFQMQAAPHTLCCLLPRLSEVWVLFQALPGWGHLLEQPQGLTQLVKLTPPRRAPGPRATGSSHGASLTPNLPAAR